MIVTEFPKTLQGWFDNAWQWAVVEKHPPATTPTSAPGFVCCRYRTTDGNRCLIGASIPDNRYTSTMEGHSAMQALAGLIPDSDLPLDLGSLQSCHDGNAAHDNYLQEVETELRRFAVDHHLTIQKPTPVRRRKKK